MTTGTVSVMEPGEITRRSTVNRTSVALRYLINRRQQLTAVHQQRIEEFAQGAGSMYQDIPALVRAYFAKWKVEYARVKTQFDKRVNDINTDRNMSSVEKWRELQRVRAPMYPAWSAEQEEAFIQTYGDPRIDMNDWNSALAELKKEVLMAWAGENEMEFHRPGWDLFMMEILEHPEIDGSVAPCFELSREQSNATHVVDGIIRTRDQFSPPVPEGGFDPDYYQAMMKAASQICPHCHDSFQKIMQHEPPCAKKHGKPSIFQAGAPTLIVGSTAPDAPEPDDEKSADDEIEEPLL